MGEVLVKLEDVRCGYDGQEIIKGVSFEIPQGHVFGLVGPNGHGKTTILRAISGLIKLRSGSVYFGGDLISSLSADQIVKKGISHIPQGDLIFSEMTVRENLLMGAYLPSAYDVRGKQIEYVYGLFPILNERKNQIASCLSGGERRMLGVGRGLMTNSEFLMIDEPSLGLAPIVIDQIYRVIQKLKAEGRTLIVVEENASRLMDLVDDIHLLDDGNVVWNGRGEDLVNDEVLMKTYLGG